ncbi:MAG: membrane dipeptidase [Thermaerobacter sp.]
MAAIVLNEDQEERARRLHFESFVYDFSPYGEPFIMTERHRRVMKDALDRGAPVGQVLYAMAMDRLAELEEDPAARETVAAVWRASGVNAVQVTLGAMEMGLERWDAVIRDAARWHRRARIGDMMICTTAADLESAWAQGRIGLVLGLQDSSCLGTDLNRLDTLYNLGVTVVQLTYNSRNLVGDGCTERNPGGISRFGARLIEHMNRLRMVVDVSHCGPQTTLDAIELSQQPIAFTHALCRSLSDHARAKSDEAIRLLAETGGYMGIVAVPFFLRRDGEAGIDDMMRHLAHAAEIMGIDRVGIATDWGGWNTDVPPELQQAILEEFRRMGFRPEDGVQMNAYLGEFVNWEDWYHITRGLVWLGLSDDEIRGVLGRNWLNYYRRIRGA